MRKLFIILLAAATLLIAFVGIYVFVFKEQIDTPDTPSQEPSTPPVIVEPESETNQIAKIVSGDVLAAHYVSDERIIYMDSDTSSVMSVTPRGSQKNVLLKSSIANIQSASWSFDGSGLLITTQTGNEFAIDLETKEPQTIDPRYDFSQWSTSSDTFIHKAFDQATGNRTILFGDKELTTIPFRYVSFSEIPDSFLLAYWPKADAFRTTELQLISTVSPGDPQLVFSGAFGADFLFAPNGDKILVSKTLDAGGGNVTLGIMNRDGGEYTNLGIPTMVSKTIWSRDNQTVFYAQPIDIPEGSILPNDYDDKKFTTRDTLWKVDIETGKKQRIVGLKELPEKIDVSQLFLSPNESSLFFINRVDNSLYRINL